MMNRRTFLQTPGGGSGLLRTAGNIVFAAIQTTILLHALRLRAKPLWNANLSTGMSKGPITYELDGHQYLVVGEGDKLFAFVMN